MRKVTGLFAVLVLLVISVFPALAQERPTILEFLENDPDARFTTLLEAIDTAELREMLEEEGPFTLLAPTNDAFAAALEATGLSAEDLMADTETLTDILLYHVVPGRYFFRNLTGSPTLESALFEEQVTFDLTDGVFTVEGANILDVDNISSNGVVHVLEGVMLPPAVAEGLGVAAEATDEAAEPEAEATPEATPAPAAAAARPDLIALLEADADGRFTTLLTAIDAAGLTETLSGDGPFTLLAPTNDAFTAAAEATGLSADALMAEPDMLSQILLYHVVPGRYFFRNLTGSPTLDSALQDEQVTFDLTDGVFTVQGANILDVDNIASNGVFHVLEGVILPPEIAASVAPVEEATAEPEAEATPEATPAPAAETTRPDLIALLEADADGRFTTLLAAIDAAGLTETLSGEGPFTVLAPTNDAFAAAAEATGLSAEALMADPDMLSQILNYHVIPGRYFFRNLTGSPTLDSALEGEQVTFDLTDGVFTVEGANILDVDNIASNGVFHVLEGVILPPEIAAGLAPVEEATAEPEAEATPEATPAPAAETSRPDLIALLEADADGRFTTLLTALNAAGLTETLSGEGPFTLLAPTNDAFVAAMEATGLSAADFVASPDMLAQILNYHVIPGRYFFRNLTGSPTLDTALEGEPVTFDLTDGVFTVQGANILDVDNIASNGVFHVLEGVILPPALAAELMPAPEATAEPEATEAPGAALDPNAGHVRFAHLSPDLGAADVYADDTLTGEAIEPGTVSDWMNFTGSVNVGIAPAGGDIATTVVGDVPAGSWVTVAVIGSSSGDTLRIHFVTEDFSPTPDGQARVSILHAVEGLGTVDVLVNEALLIGALGYPGTLGDNDGFDSRHLGAAVYDFQIVASGTASPAAIELTDVALSEGSNYLIALVGAPGASRAIIVPTPVPVAAE